MGGPRSGGRSRKGEVGSAGEAGRRAARKMKTSAAARRTGGAPAAAAIDRDANVQESAGFAGAAGSLAGTGTLRTVRPAGSMLQTRMVSSVPAAGM